MIVLHRLGHHDEPLHLNPDLITTVEAHPDTVVTLTTGTKILVNEAPEEVADAVREWRAGILDEAWRRRHPVTA
jgi:flagellar protein FlbD